MSVILKCPNCGTPIGEASHENNYKELFYGRNLDGTSICNSCGTGNDKSPFKIMFWSGVVFIFLVIILTTIF